MLSITQGCGVKGLYIHYDKVPWPTDAQFADTASPYHYPSFAAARAGFRRDHVPAVGPAIYVTRGVRVRIEFVVASRYADFVYFAPGAGQSSVSDVQWKTNAPHSSSCAIVLSLPRIRVGRFR